MASTIEAGPGFGPVEAFPRATSEDATRLVPEYADGFGDDCNHSTENGYSSVVPSKNIEDDSTAKESKELWQALQQIEALEAAYETQSQQLAEVEEERNMLSARVNELEAGIADDEAELEIAVQEMDLQMMELEHRANKAEEALQREKQLQRSMLASQALEAADMEFERKFGLSPDRSHPPGIRDNASENEKMLQKRVEELEALLQQAQSAAPASTSALPSTATPPKHLSVRTRSEPIVPEVNSNDVGFTDNFADQVMNTPPQSSSDSSIYSASTAQDLPPSVTGTPVSGSPSRAKMSTMFETMKARHKQRAETAAAALAKRASLNVARRERALSQSNNLAELNQCAFDRDLAQAVATMAMSAVGVKPNSLSDPSAALDDVPTAAEAPSEKPQPMRPYSQQSVSILKMELLKRGVLDISDCKVKSDLVRRLTELPPEAF